MFLYLQTDAFPFLVVLSPFTQKVCTSESCNDYKIVLLKFLFLLDTGLCAWQANTRSYCSCEICLYRKSKMILDLLTCSMAR